MTVTIKTNIVQFRKSIRKQISNLSKQKSVTNTRVARFLQRHAKLMAPVGRTQKLINSIKIIPVKKDGRSVRVTARGRKNFPYPRWVNQSPGFEILRYPNGGPFGLKRGSFAIYGLAPANWRWTGTQGFFDLAIQKTNRRFPQIASKGYNKALGIRIG